MTNGFQVFRGHDHDLPPFVFFDDAHSATHDHDHDHDDVDGPRDKRSLTGSFVAFVRGCPRYTSQSVALVPSAFGASQ